MNVQTELEQVKEALKLKRQTLKDTQEDMDHMNRRTLDEIHESQGTWNEQYDILWAARHKLKTDIRHLQKRQAELNKLK